MSLENVAARRDQESEVLLYNISTIYIHTHIWIWIYCIILRRRIFHSIFSRKPRFFLRTACRHNPHGHNSQTNMKLSISNLLSFCFVWTNEIMPVEISKIRLKYPKLWRIWPRNANSTKNPNEILRKLFTLKNEQNKRGIKRNTPMKTVQHNADLYILYRVPALSF